jgi:glycosyltransferase involved in cell wall biosynthesis
MTKDHPLISVIVPVYNGEKFIVRCLDAILGSDFSAFELIVVDDGSTDESARISREKGARLLATKQRQSGPAAARNIAAEFSNAEILLFVDADVVIRHDTLGKIAANFQNQPEISALFGSYDDSPFEANFLSQYRNLLHHYVHQNSNREASTFWAGLGAIRKDAFRAVGGFDAVRYAVPSIEDIELGTRLKASGRRIILDGEIQGKHLKRWTVHTILKTDIFCRAAPWSKLILTEQGLINDLNLKTSDRASALLTGASIGLLPFAVIYPLLLLVIAAFLILILLLNRRIFLFFIRRKSVRFALLAFPWQLLYFFYSGATFAICWILYALPPILGFGKNKSVLRQPN